MFNFVQRRKRFFTTLLVLLLVSGVAFYIPVPYYITQPGSLIELQPIIKVGAGGVDKDGSFMLVTVSMLNGNAAYYLYALISPYADLVRYDRLLGHEETPQDYHERQLYVMQNSQDDAILAAFNYASGHVDVSAEAHHAGVRVVRTVPGTPAEKVLQPGDVILEADGKEIHSVESLLQLLHETKLKEVVTFSVQRGEKERQVQVALDILPSTDGKEGERSRVGLGIYPVTHRVVSSTPEVTIDTNEIGGPSAGLMMALEIYNQLHPMDLTKGYRIAGTGTIDPQGKVGQIGSVDHKVAAADARAADLFFVPKDVASHDDNETVAVQTARKLGTQMNIVPVATLKDAVDYLHKLPPAADGT